MQVLLVSECFWPFFHQEREPYLLGVLVLHPAQSKCRFLSNWSLLLWVIAGGSVAGLHLALRCFFSLLVLLYLTSLYFLSKLMDVF